MQLCIRLRLRLWLHQLQAGLPMRLVDCCQRGMPKRESKHLVQRHFDCQR